MTGNNSQSKPVSKKFFECPSTSRGTFDCSLSSAIPVSVISNVQLVSVVKV